MVRSRKVLAMGDKKITPTNPEVTAPAAQAEPKEASRTTARRTQRSVSRVAQKKTARQQY
jgi:hypothetical protein